MILQHGEDAIEQGEHAQNLVGILGAQRACIGGGVGRADQIEDGSAGLGGVQVVGKRGGVVVLRLRVAAAMSRSRPSAKPPFNMR